MDRYNFGFIYTDLHISKVKKSCVFWDRWSCINEKHKDES